MSVPAIYYQSKLTGDEAGMAMLVLGAPVIVAIVAVLLVYWLRR